MKKLLLVLMVLFTITSCTTDYVAKDSQGAPILIKDMHDVIKDAQTVGADSIYVVKYMRQDHFTPLRRMGVEGLESWEYDYKGEKKTAYALYRRLALSEVYER